MVTPAHWRKAVAYLVANHAMSERRACKAIDCCRMMVRYRSSRPDDCALRERMIAIARERRRFGYPLAGRQLLAIAARRRLHVLLRREGHVVNHKKLFRLYREAKLAVRRRGGRKRAIGTRAPMLLPIRPNERWSLDFVSDQLTDGRRFRILTIVDDCTRENLALVADTSLSGARVARELDRLMIDRGRPKMIVSEFERSEIDPVDRFPRGRQRIHEQCHPILGRSNPCRMALHRSRKADAKRLHRELQWSPA